jgi:hypothetical protein
MNTERLSLADRSAARPVLARAERPCARALQSVLILVLAVAIHAAWLMWPVAAVAPPKPAPFAPRAFFLPAGRGAVASSLDLLVWSPALFALPSSVGFSAVAFTNGIGALPRWPADRGQARFLDDGPPALPAAATPGAPAWDASSRLEAFRFEDRPARAAVAFAGDDGAPPVEVYVRMGDRPPRRVLMEGDGAVRGVKPWEAEVRIETTTDGRVARVFLTSPAAETAVNRWVVRQSYTLPAELSRKGQAGAAYFRYRGRAAAAAAALQEAAAP